MPSIDIVRLNEIKTTFRVKSIIDRHELKPDSANVNLHVEMPIENIPWQIGVIVGSSGSGKSTIAKQLFSKDYIHSFNYNQSAIIDEMPQNKSIDEIGRAFNSVGFGTIWNWIKPYEVLSTGEKMRVDLARALLEDRELVVFDEFTSVVDREIAKVASYSISKAIRKNNKKFIAVTCHRDILEWLEPDWVYDTDVKEFFFAQGNTLDLWYKSKLKEQTSGLGAILKTFTI